MPIYSAGQLTVDSALRDVAAAEPQRRFLGWDGGWTSYGSFDRRVSQFANAITGLGVARGDRVAVRLPNGPHHLVTVFGLHRAGCVYVGCSTALSKDQIAYQFAHSEPSAIICAEHEAEAIRDASRAAGLRSRVICAEDGPSELSGLIDSASDVWEQPPPGQEELASILYTSGTTGRPKGVMWSHGFFYWKGFRAKEALEYGHEDVLLNFFPLPHSNGGSSLVVPPILVGGGLALQPKFSSSRFVRALVEYDATVVGLNATHAKMLMARPPEESDRAHRATRAQFGLFLEPSRRRAFEARFGIRLVEVYGQTETGIVCASRVWANHSDDSFGLPLSGVQVKLVDEDLREVSAGESGQILVASQPPNSVAMGYYRDPAGTAALLKDGWLHTGDLGRVTHQGFLQHTGRMSETIKRSGYNIDPVEVERALLEYEQVTDAAIVAIPDEIRDFALVAYWVKGAASPPPSDEDLLAWLREKLAPHQIPTHFVELPAMPESVLGKIDKTLLREQALARFADKGAGR